MVNGKWLMDNERTFGAELGVGVRPSGPLDMADGGQCRNGRLLPKAISFPCRGGEGRAERMEGVMFRSRTSVMGITMACGLAVVVCLVPRPANVTAADDEPKPIRALLVIGGCCHEY